MAEQRAVVAAQIINPSTTCEIDVHLEDEAHEPITVSVRLGYYRARVTRNFFKDLDAITELEDDDEGKRQLDALFLRVVRWWNVLQQTGKPETIPLTEDAIAPLDAYFIGELVFGIIKHARTFVPGEAPREKPNVTPLNGSSRRTAKRINSRRA